MEPIQVNTASPAETEGLGAELAKRWLRDPALPRFVALYGDLGVGKTAFVRGVASVLTPGSIVRSPTFALVHEHKGKLPLFHFDMYRITDEDELYSIGFDDYLAREGVILVEWSENIPYALPEAYLRVTITKNDLTRPDSRSISIEEVRVC